MVVAWTDERRGTGVFDIYAAIYQLDFEPPQISWTTAFEPPARIYDPEFQGYDIYTIVDDGTDGSGIESVFLVYTMDIPRIFHEASYTDSVPMQRIEDEFFKATLPAPEYQGTDIKYCVRARDRARNPARYPRDINDFLTIAVNELGDVNGDGCHTWTDLLLLNEYIGESPQLDGRHFFADLDQDNDIDIMKALHHR
jgi:hypothetical protein